MLKDLLPRGVGLKFHIFDRPIVRSLMDIMSWSSGYIIPKGWKVLVWFRTVHLDPEIYPNPKEFNPSRWDVSQSAPVVVTIYIIFWWSTYILTSLIVELHPQSRDFPPFWSWKQAVPWKWSCQAWNIYFSALFSTWL